MRIKAKDLDHVRSRAAAPPPVVEPVLSPRDEAHLLTRRRTSDPTVAARRDRVRALMLSVATPTGDDAALLVLLADAGALPIANARDRLSARQRLIDIGNAADPGSDVEAVMRRHRVAARDGAGLADALLAGQSDLGAFGDHWASTTGGGAAT